MSLTTDLKTRPKVKVIFLPDVRNLNVVQVAPRHSEIQGGNQFYEELKPIWQTLKLVGLLPLQTSQAGLHSFSYSSKEMCYFMFVLTLSTITTVAMLFERVSVMLNTTGDNLDRMVFSANMILLVTPPLVIPFTYLWNIRDIAKLLNDWKTFQGSFYRVTRRPLSLSFGRLPTVLLATAFTANAAFLSSQYIFVRFLGSYESIFYVYCQFLFNVHVVLWFLLCSSSSRAAKKLTQDFEQDFSHSRGNHCQLISDYRCLWLQLSKLTRDFGNAFCYTFAYLLTMWFVSHLMLLFVVIVGVSSGATLWHLTITMYLLGTAESVHWFCVFGHLATEAVGDEVMEKLLEFTVEDEKSSVQLEKFERAVFMHPPTVCLGGYLKVNKELFISHWSITITYMVVLLQMHFSDEAKPCIETQQQTTSSADYNSLV